jgi:hypothetical protein
MPSRIIRTTKVQTSIHIENINIEKLKMHLEGEGYLDQIDDFNSEEELVSILKQDSYAASLVFQIMINYPGYSQPQERFLDDEAYHITS